MRSVACLGVLGGHGLARFLKSLLSRVGARCLAVCEYTGGLTILLLDSLWWLAVAPLKKKGKVRYEEALFHTEKIGVHSLGIVSIVVLFVGIILALQMAYVLKTLGVLDYVADITAVAMAREMAPLLVGMVMTGFLGAAIAAEIGTMVVSEEVLALQISGLEPIRFLVAPRMLATLISMPFVSLIAAYVGILGGFFVGYFLEGMGAAKYLHRTLEALRLADVITGLVKAEAFGILISLIACREGFRVAGGAEGVGRATTSSVVRCVVAIIVCDLFFTALFSFLG